MTKFNNTVPTKDTLYTQRLKQTESKKWESVFLKKARTFIAGKQTSINNLTEDEGKMLL